MPADEPLVLSSAAHVVVGIVIKLKYVGGRKGLFSAVSRKSAVCFWRIELVFEETYW